MQHPGSRYWRTSPLRSLGRRRMAKRFTPTCRASSNSSPYLARSYRTTNPISSKSMIASSTAGPKRENSLSRLTPGWSLRATRLSRTSGEKNSRKKLLKGNTKSPECAVDDSGVRSLPTFRVLQLLYHSASCFASAQFVHEVRTFLSDRGAMARLGNRSFDLRPAVVAYRGIVGLQE